MKKIFLLNWAPDALTEMGYPDDILTPQTRSLTDNYEFDAESVWEKGTFSSTELAVNWSAVHGNALLFRVGENLR